jgi:hypothetical protein
MNVRSKLVIFCREALVFFAFCGMTALVTWPYAKHIRDVVADEGDPYLISWIIWWDYHQTFAHPLQLFHSNIFYPYPYSLAFSEHSYGISILFFPLYAAGLPPLTVHAIAMFVGFALCGYGAFRLARTLTGSNTVAWIAGIAFAFTPFRYDQMSQLTYLFTFWIPISLEALILFARHRKWRHAAWLGVAFFMLGMSAITWLTFSLVVLTLAALVLITRYGLWRNGQFWWRGFVALGIACVALLPFTVPYLIVSRMYGFVRSVDEVKENSALPIDWLFVNPRVKLWNALNGLFVDNRRFRLFPGLLPIVFSAAAILWRAIGANNPAARIKTRPRTLDALIVITLAVAIFASAFDGTFAVLNYLKSEFAWTLLIVLMIARCCIRYPDSIHAKNGNLRETIRGFSSDAVWLGILLTIVGFCFSLGWNFFFYRLCYDLIPLFRSMRMPTRGAMYAHLGLAILAGVGVKAIVDVVSNNHRQRRAITVAMAGLLLFELNATPMVLVRGDVYPDSVTRRLKETPMRGGIVMLPAGGGFNHHHVLRAADHAKPLITATSGFTPPYELQIENATNSGPISAEFLDLLEKIPASYVVVLTHLIRPERKAIYESFLARAVATGRLRFVNRFDAHDDLYAVVKTEPAAQSEGALPFAAPRREWSSAVADDPLNLMSHSFAWTQSVYGMYLAGFGRMPRYTEFLHDIEEIGKGVIMGSDEVDPPLKTRLESLAKSWESRPEFSAYGRMTDDEYLAKLLENARLQIDEGERSSLATMLKDGSVSRAAMLVRIGADWRLQKREENRALVLFHFFAYLHRNPDDPPDINLNGLEHWVQHLERHGSGELTTAFSTSIERAVLLEREQRK